MTSIEQVMLAIFLVFVVGILEETFSKCKGNPDKWAFFKELFSTRGPEIVEKPFFPKPMHEYRKD